MTDPLAKDLDSLQQAVPLKANEASLILERSKAYLGASWLKDLGVLALTLIFATLLSIPLFQYSRSLSGITGFQFFFVVFLLFFTGLSYGASRFRFHRLSESLLIFALGSSSVFAWVYEGYILTCLVWFGVALWALHKHKKPLLHGTVLLIWSVVLVVVAARLLANYGPKDQVTNNFRYAFGALAIAAGSIFHSSRTQQGDVLYEYLLRPVHKNVSCFVMLFCLLGLCISLDANESPKLLFALAAPLTLACGTIFWDGRKRKDAVPITLSVVFTVGLVVVELDRFVMKWFAPSIVLGAGISFLILAFLRRRN
ncbi:MAG: hypothetical protein P1V97_24185 [Planctomycetota bacterium]|nr:hypothetical protein [Planctomycetota bacterium]